MLGDEKDAVDARLGKAVNQGGRLLRQLTESGPDGLRGDPRMGHELRGVGQHQGLGGGRENGHQHGHLRRQLPPERRRHPHHGRFG